MAANKTKIVARFPKNAHQEVRVTVGQFKGHDLVSLRVWAKLAHGGWKPTKQGVAFRMDQLDELLEALARAGSFIGA